MAESSQAVRPDQASRQRGAMRHEDATTKLLDYLRAYAQDNPGTAALWCFGIGFVLGWRLKPW